MLLACLRHGNPDVLEHSLEHGRSPLVTCSITVWCQCNLASSVADIKFSADCKGHSPPTVFGFSSPC